MKTNALEFSIPRFLGRLLPLTFVALALSLVSLSHITPQPLAQTAQTTATAPGANGSDAARVVYPKTRKDATVDDYFGTKVADPYRWLEDDRSAETSKWVEAQNKVTLAYLDKIPFRQKIKDRLTQLFNYPRYSEPVRRGDYYFFAKNDGLQNQGVWYAQKGLDGAPEILLDPNKLSPDGTTQLVSFGLSRHGEYFGYGVSRGGSDWVDIYVIDVATKQLQSDHVEWVKFSDVSWQGDGFYYSRFPTPEKGHELTAKNEFHRVFYHKLGTPQSEDTLVYEDKTNPVRRHKIATSDDERFAFLTVSEMGSGKQGNALFYRDASKPGDAFAPIVAEIAGAFYKFVGKAGDKFLIHSGRRNGQVFLFDPENPDEKNWKYIVPAKPEQLDIVNEIGGKLFVTYLKDVTARAYVYSFDGILENEIVMPGPGTVSGFPGREDHKFTFYTFSTFNFPPTTYKYDIATKKSTLFRQPEIPGFKSSDYETSQVFYNSKDGTRVPMFIVHKKGIKLDGNNPTLLYGYGGFFQINYPGFSTLLLPLLEQGFVYASANIRGGGEYGGNWHDEGTKLRKQNSFDDFIAAAEYLIAKKYTSPEKLSIQGSSNGGLLVAAVVNQRPELFKAAIPAVGVMDMLRFHKFTTGASWIAEYGSSGNAAEFKALYAYSPIHNVRSGVKHPATLIITADHDDRVVPAHSFKYAAALQAAQAGENPILIRIDTKSGHRSSSTAKTIEETADVYSFLMRNLGVTPK